MLIASFFWAIGHPLGRIIVQRVHPFQLGTITLSSGFIGLLIFLISTGRIRKIVKFSSRDILFSIGIGIIGFSLYQVLTFSALARIPASMNAVLLTSNVLFIAILSAVILKERITLPRIIGIVLALCGAILVIFNAGFSSGMELGGMDLFGISFSFMAALSFAIYTVIGKKVLTSNDPLIVTLLALLSGTIILSILTAATIGFSEIIFAGWQILLLMIFLGLTMIGIAYPIWFICLKRLPASHVSVYIYLTPIFAVILSVIILKETFSWLFWVGGALVLGGIFITNKFALRKSAREKGK